MDDDFEAWAAPHRAQFAKNAADWFSQNTYSLSDLLDVREHETSEQAFAAWLSSRWERELESRREAAERRRKAFFKTFPLRAAEVALEADVRDPGIAAILAWHETTQDRGGIAIINGPTGTGKTVAACRWAWACRARPAFVLAADLATLSRYADERDEFYEAHALLIDDLGAEYADAKGSFAADFDELINKFYSSKRQLVITTNLPREKFIERYGKRVADRMNECGTWIAMSGPSRRKGAS